MGKTRGIDGAIEAYNDAEVYGYAGGAAGYPSSMGSGISGNLKVSNNARVYAGSGTGTTGNVGIKLDGSNKRLELNDNGYIEAKGSYGLYAIKKNTIVVNGGKLECTGGDCGIWLEYNTGYAANMSVHGGEVVANGDTYGFYGDSYSSLLINGGKVEITGGEYGVYQYSTSSKVEINADNGGGHVIVSGESGAFSRTPTVSQYYDYEWRTDEGGAFTPASTTPYSWNSSQTYVEIRPVTAGETYVDITGASVAVAEGDYTYTGKAIEPEVTVTLGGKELVKGTDYTVDYSNNTNAGTATATVTGMGNYTGTAAATFEIGKATPEITLTGTANGPTEVTLTATAPEGLTVEYAFGMTNTLPENEDAWQESDEFTNLTAGTAYYFFAKTAETQNYNAGSASCTVTTPEKAIESISLSGEYKTAYTAGEKLDLSGLTVTVTYNDGTTETVSENITSTPAAGTELTTDDTTVTITYGGKDATYSITVTEPDEPGTDPDPDPDEPGTDPDPDPDEPGTDPDWPDWPDRPDRPNYPDDEPVYAPEVDVSGGGSVDVSPSRPEEGDTVIITPEPDDGYVTGDVSVTDADGDEVDVDRRPDGSYSFVQPKGEVEISVSFVPVRLPFADVSAGSWYYDAVEFVWSNGIMDGVGSGLFAPNQVLTRAMLVTVLWRIDGAPDVSAALPFDDVADGSWYADAVRWAASNGIVDGTGETSFSPDDKITREQLAVILWRYAGYKSCDTTGGVDLTDFADRGSVSAYALRAMRWAVAEGLVTGVTDDTIAPLAGTTRAEAAAVLQRFSENILTLQSA